LRTDTDRLVLGIDLGTESLRVAAVAPDGTELASASAGYASTFPQPDFVEQSPADWWQSLRNALGLLSKQVDLKRIQALAISATSSTVLAVDKNTGEPLGPALLWMDSRAKEEAKVINRTGHPALRYSGGQVSVEWMVPKTLWLRKHMPELATRPYRIVEALDWLNFKLTGRWAASRLNAVCKWLYVDELGGWDPTLFEQIGLPDVNEIWPSPVLPVGTPVERIRPQVAAELGLASDVLVAQGGIDAHLGLLGMGVNRPGQMGLIAGTSFVHMLMSDRPLFHPGLWGPYWAPIYPDQWLIEGGQISCGSITRWFRETCCRDLPQTEEAYSALIAEAAQTPPGADGLCLLDFWQGNRTPYRDPDVSGAIWGLRLHHNRGHLFRAIMEGIACGTRNILEVAATAGGNITEIIASGGATKNRLWMQILADITGRPITISANANASCLGAAVAAAVGLGWYPSLVEAADRMTAKGDRIEPDPANAAVYQDLFETYVATCNALFPLMHNKAAKAR